MIMSESGLVYLILIMMMVMMMRIIIMMMVVVGRKDKNMQSCEMSFLLHKAFKPNFFPKKSAEIATILALDLNKTNKKDNFGEQSLSNWLVC